MLNHCLRQLLNIYIFVHDPDCSKLFKIVNEKHTLLILHVNVACEL